MSNPIGERASRVSAEHRPSRVAPLVRRQSGKTKVLKAAEEIRSSPELKSADWVFTTTQLTQVTLPHSNPKGNPPTWKRTNGKFTLRIQPGYITDPKTNQDVCLGYPYGTVPRLLLIWLITEARRTQSPHISLGNSLHEFVDRIGMNSGNGSTGSVRSDKKRLLMQGRRLFKAILSFDWEDDNSSQWVNMPITDQGALWWSSTNDSQGAFWDSWIDLGDRFYEAILRFPVNLDMRAIEAVKNSALGLDLYCILMHKCWEANSKNRNLFIPWQALQQQLGTEVRTANNFRIKSKEQLAKIQAIHGNHLKAAAVRGGLMISRGSQLLPTP